MAVVFADIYPAKGHIMKKSKIRREQITQARFAYLESPGRRRLVFVDEPDNNNEEVDFVVGEQEPE